MKIGNKDLFLVIGDVIGFQNNICFGIIFRIKKFQFNLIFELK